MTYEEQLNDPRWKALRNEVIERDLFMCQKCMKSKNLQVHHKYYESGKMAWEYPLTALITLCKGCHAIHHGIITPDPKPYTYWRRPDESRPIKTIRMVMIEFIELQIIRLNQ